MTSETPLRDETLDRFYAFREKALELEQGGFVQRSSGNLIRLRWSREGFTSDGPDLDQRKSAGTTARIFLSENDDISFAKIASLNDPALTEDWRTENKAVRKSITAALGEVATLPALPGEETTLTRRQVLDAWLYGDLTHVQDREDERRRHQILSLSLINLLYQSAIHDALLLVIVAVFNMKDAMERELARHDRSFEQPRAPRALRREDSP